MWLVVCHVQSLEDGNAPVNTTRLSIVDRAINMGESLANNYYLPDLLAIGTAYVKAGRVDGGGMARACPGLWRLSIEPSGTSMAISSESPDPAQQCG